MRSNRVIALTVVLLLLLVGAVALSGCSKAPTTATPSTKVTSLVAPPTLVLVAPVDGSEIAAGDVKMKVETTGLKFVMPSNKLVDGEGHVHFTLDGEPAKMSTSPEYVYEGVAPGAHTLVAELVQNDTKPFSPPILQQVTFTAK